MVISTTSLCQNSMCEFLRRLRKNKLVLKWLSTTWVYICWYLRLYAWMVFETYMFIWSCFIFSYTLFFRSGELFINFSFLCPGLIWPIIILTASLWFQKINAGGSGLCRTTQVRLMVLPRSMNNSGPPTTSVSGSEIH